MDHNRRIRVISDKQGVKVEVVRSASILRDANRIERKYFPVSDGSLKRVSDLVYRWKSTYLLIRPWGITACWFIP